MKTAKCSRPALKMAKGGIVRYPLDSEPSPTGGVRGYGVPHLQAGLVPVVETAAQRMERDIARR